MERLSLRVVGVFRVEGLDEHALGSRKARTLLRVLACERGGAVSTDRLADALWGDELPAKPSDQVSVLVSRLRAVLGPRIPRSDAGYSLQYDWLDLDELLARSREAVARLGAGHHAAARVASASALRLVQGPVLADDDALWAQGVRAEIERAVAEARLAGARAALEVRAFEEAAELGSAAMVSDPFDEVALRVVMRAHAQLGRPGSALAAYTTFKERIVDEFGVGPTTETEQVHDAIVLGSGHDHDEYEATATLVGRDGELAALDAWLVSSASASTLVVVEGDPGIGKSALIGEWRQRAERRGAHVLFARCDQPGLSLPLQPIIDAITDWVARVLGPEQAALLVGGEPVLASTLGRRGSARPVDSVRSHESVEEPELGRRRLFDALGALVDRVRGDAPVVLIIDDVHEADAGTLSFVASYVRSAKNAMVLLTSRDPLTATVGGNRLVLGPIDRDAAAQLVSDDAVSRLYDRSGGNPLFLLELAHVGDGELPTSIVEAVRRRSATLGPAASTVRVAALLGLEIDLDLLTACCRRPVAEVLDHIEVAMAHGLLVDEAAGLRFRHDVVREALVAATTESVRAFVHREASVLLSARPDRSPLDAAHHAERGGTETVAADAFLEGAQVAMDRFEAEVAVELLDRAIARVDSCGARVARARVHLTRRDLHSAHADIEAALHLDRSPAALGLAGWIAYYRRDYPAASAFASEALQTAASPELRASAATLEGRVRHSQGDLDGALACLEPVVAAADEGIEYPTSGVARVWLAAVLTHRGRAEEGLHMLDSAGDPRSLRSHPFATAHALFVRCHASGIAGDLATAYRAADALHEHAHHTGVAGVRFRPFACNMRAWLERSVGNFGRAGELSEHALLDAVDASFDEPATHARLDQVELLLARHRLDAAADMLRVAREGFSSTSTMAWHLHQRMLLLSGRLSLLTGDPDRAALAAYELAVDARSRSSERYGVLAWQLRLLTDATLTRSLPAAEIDELLPALDRLAALDGWWLIAELAAASGIDRLWSEAESRSVAMSARAADVAHLDAHAVRAWMGSTIDGLRRRS